MNCWAGGRAAGLPGRWAAGRLDEAEALLMDPQALYNPRDELAQDDSERRAKLMKAVALPTHASTMRDLSTAMKNLMMLERQAFNVPDAPEPEPEPAPADNGTARAVTDSFRRTQNGVCDAN